MSLGISFIIFLFSAIALYICCENLVKILTNISSFLAVREFVISFFILAFASAMPNLFLGISSALNGIPQLSLGDIIGNNLVATTLAVALGVLFSKNKKIETNSRTVQSTTFFTLIAALLPLILIYDHQLSRSDGLILILGFLAYLFWLFSKKERFQKIYQNEEETPKIDNTLKNFRLFIKNIFIILGLIIAVFIVSQLIVFSAQSITKQLGISLLFFGLIVTGLASAMPEVYFAINAAKREENWMILGNLMGSIIFPATLILGLIALIHPIDIPDVSSIFIARFFMIAAITFFFIFVQTDKKISKKEAIFLLLLYGLYLLFEILKNI